MALYERLIGIGQPKIDAHAWPHMYQQYWGSIMPIATLVESFDLSPENEDVTSLNVVTDRLTMPFVYDWQEDDGVYIKTTGTLPAGLSADTIYYVLNPNSGTGTMALSATKAGSAVNITSQGTGTHSVYLIDPDIIHWEETRNDVTHSGAWNQKAARFIWDQAAEGTVLIAEAGVDYQTVASLKTTIETQASRLSE